MNYDVLLNMKIKYHLLFVILTIILICSFGYIINLKIFDTYNCKGIYNEDFIYINVPITYSDTLTKGNYLKINKEKYLYEIAEISEIEVDPTNLINYQTFKIKIEKEFINNELIDITIYSNKEKIIEKLKELM